MHFCGLQSVCGRPHLAGVLCSTAHTLHRGGVGEKATLERKAALEDAAAWRVASTSKTMERHPCRSQMPPMESLVHASRKTVLLEEPAKSFQARAIYTSQETTRVLARWGRLARPKSAMNAA